MTDTVFHFCLYLDPKQINRIQEKVQDPTGSGFTTLLLTLRPCYETVYTLILSYRTWSLRLSLLYCLHGMLRFLVLVRSALSSSELVLVSGGGDGFFPFPATFSSFSLFRFLRCLLLKPKNTHLNGSLNGPSREVLSLGEYRYILYIFLDIQAEIRTRDGQSRGRDSNH